MARIGFDVPFPPFAFIERGEPRGMLIDLVGKVLRRAGIEIAWHAMTLAATEPALYAGEVDALAFKGVTPERHGVMDFSPPLVVSGSALFRRPELSASDDPRAFAGKRVATPRQGPMAAKLAHEYPELELVLVDSYEAAFETLLAGDAELAALNFHAGLAMANALHPGRVGLPSAPYAPLPIAFAVAKGRSVELLRRFCAALEPLRNEGALQPKD